MSKVPSGLHAAAKGPLKLAGGDTFLAAAKQVDRLKPEPQREVAILENRADTHGKGLAAGIALAQADAGSLALKASNLGAIGVLTMRANGSIRPKLCLNVGKSGFLIVKTGVG
jgi:hypothetical protein